MTGTQALLISGQISLPVSVSAVAAAAGIKVIDYATFRAQFENSLDDICRMVSYAGFCSKNNFRAPIRLASLP